MAENSKSERKSPGRPFEPGQSGNPGGRPKAFREYQQWLSDNVLGKAKAALVDMLENGDDKARAFAVKEVNDRLFGKAPQAITGEDGRPLLGSPELFLELLKKLGNR